MTLQDIMIESVKLSSDEKLQLATFLIEQARSIPNQEKSDINWSDIMGALPYPMVGEDAQVWVSNMREEWEEREEQWRGDE
jgi:hypothetical protein